MIHINLDFDGMITFNSSTEDVQPTEPLESPGKDLALSLLSQFSMASPKLSSNLLIESFDVFSGVAVLHSSTPTFIEESHESACSLGCDLGGWPLLVELHVDTTITEHSSAGEQLNSVGDSLA